MTVIAMPDRSLERLPEFDSGLERRSPTRPVTKTPELQRIRRSDSGRTSLARIREIRAFPPLSAAIHTHPWLRFGFSREHIPTETV